ncbi:hypothetical protein PILCRDRAFT_191632 [Piloderma croceum F 1598]|uniref:Major facilitator superfamily (MFS) profile domain-containing protein n=1 Tax=Piloderma croceum (strain F 1598) TaxID=765440 RepID=A0A0C3BSY6_PILCF|nr:hypothetical protein PILCRDRAFT_191632 [Piloderma croceum F 1598]
MAPEPAGATSADKTAIPDGGLRAWLVVIGAACNNAATFGLINSWGVFQAYYETNIMSGISASQIAWIGSIQYSLVFLPGLLVGWLFDLGYHKIPVVGASALFIVTTFLTPQCTQYWNFLLCQGFVVGLSCGTIFGPTTAVLSQWFQKRLGVALGVAAVGGSIGGTVFPIIARRLIPVVGFKWTMRIISLILIMPLGVGSLTVARRIPPIRVPGGLWNLAAFSSRPYTIYCCSGFVTFLGLYTVLTYIDISAERNGISADFSFYLVSIANAASGISRILSCETGPLNLMIPMTACAGILTYVWPLVHGKGLLVTIAVLYGFCIGTYNSLLTLPIISMGVSGDVGRRIGMFMSITAIGALVGPPISGTINSITGGYKWVGTYAGSTIMLAVALIMVVRYLVLRKMWGKF